MQRGDLETFASERIVIVIEGVLCKVNTYEEKRRFRTPTINYSIHWYETPMKRVVYTKEQYPQYSIDVVTFIPDPFLESAVEFLRNTGIPFDTALSMDLDQFCYRLRFQDDLRAIYDSDPARLDRYGQLGVQVQPGRDF